MTGSVAGRRSPVACRLSPVLLLALATSAHAAPLSSPEQMTDEYRAFLDRGRTPSRVVAGVVKHGGFEVIDPFATAQRRVKAGDRLLFVNQDRTAILVVVGSGPLARVGARLIGAHIDTPSPRLSITSVDRRGQARLSARAYGGMRRHHWGHTPVAVVGRVARAGGGEVDVALGLDDDFAFQVDARGDEDLVLTTAVTPGDADDARTLMKLLHERYQLTARDLAASELYLVPRARARLVGVDRALIGAHGQDDRANSYAAWRAIADLDGAPARTAMVWLVDREEAGSSGRSGARSRFLEMVIAWLLRAQGSAATEAILHRTLGASVMLSADTPACINPNWPEVQEAKNAPVLGRGPALFPFTGRGGKSGGSAAGAPLIASIRRSFDRAGAPLQFGELGKVDEGGGGTIAKYLAERGVDVVDVGVCVISMHSPMELSAVDDLWSAYRGFKHWLAEP
jgi:aspartyl aminopeptidase